MGRHEKQMASIAEERRAGSAAIERLNARHDSLLTRHNALVIEHAALLINNTALVEAVEWEMECEDVAQWRYEVWEMAEVGSGDCEIYTVAQCIHDEARSEVERLIATESAADCKGEG